MLHRATITLTKYFEVDEYDREFKDFLWKHDVDLSEASGSATISERDFGSLLQKNAGLRKCGIYYCRIRRATAVIA